jgi:hypothetical protein
MTLPEFEMPHEEGGEPSLGAVSEEIGREFRVKMSNVPRHLSKSERAAAILVLREQMMMHFQALSLRRLHRSRRPLRCTNLRNQVSSSTLHV